MNAGPDVLRGLVFFGTLGIYLSILGLVRGTLRRGALSPAIAAELAGSTTRTRYGSLVALALATAFGARAGARLDVFSLDELVVFLASGLVLRSLYGALRRSFPDP